jgi:NitT/TauT family transport system ATP-binding protein
MNGTDERTLRIEQLAKRFGGKQPVTVFEGFSLDVRAGEFLSVVGPSGCGKSTLLQVVAGLIAGSGGRVLLGGREVTGEPAHMVYLFQQYSKSLLPWMTVEDNVTFAFNHRLRLPIRPRRIRGSSRAACSSASRSRGRCRRIPKCC